MSRIAVVQEVYAAFGRGDVEAILEVLDDDVRWDQWETGNSAQEAGLEHLAPRRGRDEVGGFFATLGALEFHAFEPRAFLEGDDHVAALIRVDVTVRSTGRRFQDDELHLWTFGADDRVTALRHFLDTAKQIAATASG